MKTLYTLLMIAVTFTLTDAYAAKPGSEASAVEYVFVGLSDDNFIYNEGLLSFQGVCKATYGDQARPVTSKEIIDMGGVANLQSTFWVQPVFILAMDTKLVDYSGAQVTGNCWAGGGGLTFRFENQQFTVLSCTNLYPVGCMAPQ